jgi:predicted outer membrane repeat protein
MPTIKCIKILFNIFLLTFFFVFHSSAYAANQVVTNNSDSGAGSFRQAITDVGDGENITFNLSSGNETITLLSAISSVTKSLTIDGSNTSGSGTRVTVKVTTPGTSTYRLLNLRPSSGKTATITNLNLQGGVVTDGGGAIKVDSANGSVVLDNVEITDSDGGLYGGGFYGWTVGNVTIQNSTFENNEASTASSYGGGAIFLRGIGNIVLNNNIYRNNSSNYQGGAIYIFDEIYSIDNSTFDSNSAVNSGGAIYVDGTATGTSTITNSTFVANTLVQSPSNDFGGAIYLTSGGTHQITNSTFFDNDGQIGGAIAITNSSTTLTVTSSTVSQNVSSSTLGGGIYVGSSSVFNMKNTILANNIANSTSNDFYADGTATDNGYNIVEFSTNKTWNATGSISGNQTNLNLSSTLADNGTLNSTQTLEITSGSVAIDAGNSSSNSGVTIPDTDQRGLSRVGTYDIGAFEFGGTSNSAPVLGYSADNTLGSPTQATDGSGNITIPFRAKDADGDPVTTTGWQYSDNAGSSWNNLSASDLTGEDGSKNSATDWTGTEYSIVWNSKNQIDDTSQSDIRFRFKINDGVSDSAYGTTTDFSVDNQDPSVSTLSPADNATGIAVNADLVITLSENVTVNTGNLTVYKSSDNSNVDDMSVGDLSGNGTNALTANFSSNLAESTGFYVQIDSGAFKDAKGNSFAGISDSTSWSFTTGDFTQANISSIESDPSTNDVTISWVTNEVSSSKVEYGLVQSYGQITSETDTSPRVTEHEVEITSLVTCARYYFRVISIDESNNTSTSSLQMFNTTGCVFNSILESESEEMDNSSGGTLIHSHNGAITTMNIPSGFSNTDATFQINRLDDDNVAGPSGKNLVNGNILEFVAADLSGNRITTFDEDIQIVIDYDSDIEESFIENTLDLYKYDSGEWVEKNCTLDISANTLTCELSSFSTYGIFGQRNQNTSSDDDDSDDKKSKKKEKCYSVEPTQTEWIKMQPMQKDGTQGMYLTWTQYMANKVTIKIDDGTGTFPWQIYKTANDGQEFLPNVAGSQLVQIIPYNECKQGTSAIDFSRNNFPQGWFKL